MLGTTNAVVPTEVNGPLVADSYFFGVQVFGNERSFDKLRMTGRRSGRPPYAVFRVTNVPIGWATIRGAPDAAFKTIARKWMAVR